MNGKSENKNDSVPGPAQAPLSEEERAKILETALKRMVLIDGKVYGLEDENEPSVDVDCKAKISSCRAFCCRYVFALTQEEVRKGIYAYNRERPYYMAKDADGYCPYLDRTTCLCTIHEQRPLRCRKYACRR